MKLSSLTPCPCLSGSTFSSCCAPYLSGAKKPDTPEKLMRSRYTAFTKADVDYLKKTASGKALQMFDQKQTKNFASSVKWLGLAVIKSEVLACNKIGYVEFIATYLDHSIKQQIHEISRFEMIDGKWFYTEGNHIK